MMGEKCSVTYADYLGKPYWIYQGIYMGCSALALAYTNFNLFQSLMGDWVKNTTQRRMLVLAWIASIFLVVQSVDPEGYNNIIN